MSIEDTNIDIVQCYKDLGENLYSGRKFENTTAGYRYEAVSSE